MTPIMLRFSLEILWKIVAHMDHYTVVALLRAVPEYYRYAVLVTDHQHCPLFFDLEPVIKRMSLYICRQERRFKLFPVNLDELFTPEAANLFPIRLFEVHEPFEHPHLLMAHLPKNQRYTVNDSGELDPSWIDNPGFNNTSFVFVDASSHHWPEAVELSTRLDHLRGSKWHVGYPTYLPAVGISRFDHFLWLSFKNRRPMFSTHLPSPVTFQEPRFVTMRLENVAVFADLKLPHLVDLVLVYNNGSELVPVIEGLEAPNICRFIIHSDVQVPLFRRMGRLTTRRFSGANIAKRFLYPYTWRIRSFELCQIDGIGGLARGARSHEVCHQKRRASDMSLSFMKRFQYVLLSGVPWFLLTKMNVSVIWRLNLSITETVGECAEGVLEFPSLACLTITIKADNHKLPKFIAPCLGIIDVQIRALNPDLTGLWHPHVNGNRSVHTVTIYSDPTLPHRASRTGGRMYLVTKAEERRIRAIFDRPSYSVRKSLILKGFPDVCGL